MKIKGNPKLNIGDRVYLDSAYDEPNFITPARGVITKIENHGKSNSGKEMIKYYVEWDEGTQGGQPILSDVDLFFREEEFDKLMLDDELNERIKKKKGIKESYTITKGQMTKIIITESQYKLLNEQDQVQVQYEDGTIKNVNYQKFYYSPEFKQYKWDGNKFVIDYSKIYRNWNTMTKEEKEKVLTNRKRVSASGSYSQLPNLISMGVSELKTFLWDVVWENLTFDNMVEIIANIIKFIPPPYGGPQNEKTIKLAHGISYGIRFLFSKNDEDIAGNLVNCIFQLIEVLGSPIKVLPSTISNQVKKITKWIDPYSTKIINSPFSKKVSKKFLDSPKWLKTSIVQLYELLGEGLKKLLEQLTTNLLTPLSQFIRPYSSYVSDILLKIVTYGNELTMNLESVKTFVEYVNSENTTTKVTMTEIRLMIKNELNNIFEVNEHKRRYLYKKQL